LRTSKKKYLNRGLMSLVAALSLVVVSAGPSPADNEGVMDGAGAGTGYDEVASDPSQPCSALPPLSLISAKAENYWLHADHVGEFSGAQSREPNAHLAVYAGRYRVSVNLATHWISPAGTHTDQTLCGVPSPVRIVGATVRPLPPLPNMPTGGSISCDFAPSTAPETNQFIRVQSAVTATFDSECDLTGNVVNGTVNNIRTRHVLEGTLVPCFAPPFSDTNPNPVCTAAFGIGNEKGSLWTGTDQAVGINTGTNGP
jgi:hypothetical protein